MGVRGMKAVFFRWLVAAWLAVSLVSLAAMFQLWWGRERTLYFGKTADEQRAAVFARAGIPAPTLEMARRADAAWPLDAAYEAIGSEVSLSYFKYLVLPRIPSAPAACRIEERDVAYALTPADGEAPAHRPFRTVDPTPRGLILSALAVFAIAAGLARFGFSLPEGAAGAALLLCAAGVLLKPLCHSYAPAGVFACALGGLGAWSAWTRRGRKRAPDRLAESSPEKWENILRILAAGILALSVLWCLLMAVVVVPDDWDAWAQWGPKAKILAVSSGALGDVGLFVPGSGDYPLLWPSVWAFSGWCAGGWEEQWSKGWGALFLALAAWQIKILSDRAGNRRSAGWLFAAGFASMPAVPLVASWGYAEAPFWLMLVCAVSRLAAWRDSGARGELWRAGLFIAGAACTKNEGLLFAALGTAWVALCGRRLRDVAAVGLPALLCAGAWKTYAVLAMGASNHVLDSLRGAPPGSMHWAERLIAAAGYVAGQWSDVKQWNLVLPVALAAAAGLAWKGSRKERMNLLLPFGLLFALFGVVVGHGDNWLWQMGVAWNRLTIQFVAVLLSVLASGWLRKPPEDGSSGRP